MVIEIAGIRKNYGRREILKGVSFSASSGQCVGILGGNGCGKSTLLAILAGVLKPEDGRFLLDGEDLLLAPQRRAATVGYVPQGTPLMEELTVFDNLRLFYGRRELQSALSPAETGEKGGAFDPGEVVRRFSLGELLRQPVRRLSGGTKKRLSIACAMAGRPPVLLLDEPTAALDLPCKEEIHAYLADYRAAGGILLLVTHDLLDLTLCDSLLLLKDGRVAPFPRGEDPASLAASLAAAIRGENFPSPAPAGEGGTP